MSYVNIIYCICILINFSKVDFTLFSIPIESEKRIDRATNSAIRESLKVRLINTIIKEFYESWTTHKERMHNCRITKLTYSRSQIRKTTRPTPKGEMKRRKSHLT